jgi:hypothetical protein
MARCIVVELHFPHGHSAVTSATRPAVRYHRVITNTDTQTANIRSYSQQVYLLQVTPRKDVRNCLYGPESAREAKISSVGK